MYKAVNENIAQMPQIEANYGTTDIGAPVLGADRRRAAGPEDRRRSSPSTRAGARTCRRRSARSTTATTTPHATTREQVGSSFKPYVLSTAVSQGMNVQNSILNSSPYLCVAPDSTPMSTPRRSRPRCTTSRARTPAARTRAPIKVENDGGEIIGNPVGPKGDNLSDDDVQNALAQSSNTAFTDLAHRATTASIIQMASSFGVNINDYPSGSGLTSRLHQVPACRPRRGLADGQRADADARHHRRQRHVPPGARRQVVAAARPGRADADRRDAPTVLTPAQDSQVQYAMEDTTVNGTAVNAAVRAWAAGRSSPRPAPPRTTCPGFFIGAIPQYALVVGMFVNQQDSSNMSADNLSDPGRRRVRRLLAREHLEHLRPGRVREPDAGELPPTRSSAAQLWNHDRPAAEGEAEEDRPQVHR